MVEGSVREFVLLGRKNGVRDDERKRFLKKCVVEEKVTTEEIRLDQRDPY